jgi:hypothetical protein
MFYVESIPHFWRGGELVYTLSQLCAILSGISRGTCCALMILFFVGILPVLMDKDPIGSVFNCANPCVIKDSPGGSFLRFSYAAQAALHGERSEIIIDGPCGSACAIFADVARDRVCVTLQALFLFHKGRVQVGISFFGIPLGVDFAFDPPASRDIREWVETKGGFPLEGMVEMPVEEAKKFWHSCKPVFPLPQSGPWVANLESEFLYPYTFWRLQQPGWKPVDIIALPHPRPKPKNARRP